MLFIQSKSGLKWLKYDWNKNIIAGHDIPGRLAGGCLGSYLDCVNEISQLCFLHNQNLTWNGWNMTKIEKIIASHGISGRLAGG